MRQKRGLYFIAAIGCLGVALLLINSKEGTFMMRNSGKKISPTEAKERLSEDPETILLDVRTREEYNSGHIPKAILIPLDQLSENLSQLTNKEQPIIVYCRSGKRSALAARILIKAGYQTVFDLGGIISWPFEVTVP